VFPVERPFFGWPEIRTQHRFEFGFACAAGRTTSPSLVRRGRQRGPDCDQRERHAGGGPAGRLCQQSQGAAIPQDLVGQGVQRRFRISSEGARMIEGQGREAAFAKSQ